MGDATSWLLFLLGLLAISVFVVVLLAALVSGLVLILKRLFSGSSRSLAEDRDSTQADPSVGLATYHVVSDTVAGLNVRKRDNWFQAIFIMTAVVSFSVLGALLAALNDGWRLPWLGGALFGAFVGLVIGFFTSGIFLMVYRAVRHAQGKHE